MFVRDKNTQKLETAYLIQLFSLIPKDLVSVWKIQRPPNECHFSIFNFVPLLNFFVYFIFFNGSQISRKNHATSTCDDFVFIIFVNQPMRSKSDSKWKMASIINQAEKSIFQIRKICCIKNWWILWVFLSPNKSSFCESWNVTSYILTVFTCHIHYGLTDPLNELPIKFWLENTT